MTPIRVTGPIWDIVVVTVVVIVVVAVVNHQGRVDTLVVFMADEGICIIAVDIMSVFIAGKRVRCLVALPPVMTHDLPLSSSQEALEGRHAAEVREEAERRHQSALVHPVFKAEILQLPAELLLLLPPRPQLELQILYRRLQTLALGLLAVDLELQAPDGGGRFFAILFVLLDLVLEREGVLLEVGVYIAELGVGGLEGEELPPGLEVLGLGGAEAPEGVLGH